MDLHAEVILDLGTMAMEIEAALREERIGELVVFFVILKYANASAPIADERGILIMKVGFRTVLMGTVRQA